MSAELERRVCCEGPPCLPVAAKTHMAKEEDREQEGESSPHPRLEALWGDEKKTKQTITQTITQLK